MNLQELSRIPFWYGFWFWSFGLVTGWMLRGPAKKKDTKCTDSGK